ncbi:hypothetical protein CDAR_605471 [Caerostris darwini]|uniref:Uncharacterized protein n=1 Tax=Caerostris darwini TaxID=1538125 RepID=A0AAV4RAD1_9ARAC|nr:hypothetical protein CDAR_605471 [Caerostris darwini]
MFLRCIINIRHTSDSERVEGPGGVEAAGTSALAGTYKGLRREPFPGEVRSSSMSIMLSNPVFNTLFKNKKSFNFKKSTTIHENKQNTSAEINYDQFSK